MRTVIIGWPYLCLVHCKLQNDLQLIISFGPHANPMGQSREGVNFHLGGEKHSGKRKAWQALVS